MNASSLLAFQQTCQEWYYIPRCYLFLPVLFNPFSVRKFAFCLDSREGEMEVHKSLMSTGSRGSEKQRLRGARGKPHRSCYVYIYTGYLVVYWHIMTLCGVISSGYSLCTRKTLLPINTA
jgi:hypothetical protein